MQSKPSESGDSYIRSRTDTRDRDDWVEGPVDPIRRQGRDESRGRPSRRRHSESRDRRSRHSRSLSPRRNYSRSRENRRYYRDESRSRDHRRRIESRDRDNRHDRVRYRDETYHHDSHPRHHYQDGDDDDFENTRFGRMRTTVNARLGRLKVVDGDVPSWHIYDRMTEAFNDRDEAWQFDEFSRSRSTGSYYCLDGILQLGHRNPQVTAGGCFCSEGYAPAPYCVRVKKLDTAVYGPIKFGRGREFD